MRSALCVALYLFALTYSFCNASAQNVLTWHNDNARTGVQSHETLLTPSNVSVSLFGKLFSFAVDSSVYAQPLFVSGVNMPDGSQHNVLIVATSHDTVYAFDAEGNNPASGYLWKVSLLGAGETWGSASDVFSEDIKGDIGIVGTPVVDAGRAILYVVTKSKLDSAGTVTYFQRLHAVSLADGSEQLNGPTLIQAQLPGIGEGGDLVFFQPLLNNQRPALLLAQTPGASVPQQVYIAWASHGDKGAYHGWVIGYNAADISQQTMAWTSTPNNVEGGIWMSGGGISTDDKGTLFLVVGNGDFDANSEGSDHGASAVSLDVNSGLTVNTWFTPFNVANLNIYDADMGTSAALLLPDQPGSVPHLMVTADKNGGIYLINRDKMGGFDPASNADLHDFNIGLTIKNSFAFLNNRLYLAPDGGPLTAWTFDPATESLITPPQVSTAIFGCNNCNGSGSTPSISANGVANGVVWALDNSGFRTGPAVLHAFQASDLTRELYSSAWAGSNRDQAAGAVKFTTPTIANGLVYVGGQNAVTVYGLLGKNADFDFTQQATPPAGTSSGTSYQLLLSPHPGYGSTVSLSCDQLPTNMKCSLSPASVSLSVGVPASVTVSLTQVAATGSLTHPPMWLWTASPGLAALMLLPLGTGKRKRPRQMRRTAALAVICVVLGISALGCGGSGSANAPVTQPTTTTAPTTFRVTASDGLNSHSVFLQLPGQ